MTQALIRLAENHRDLVEEKGLDIDYSKLKPQASEQVRKCRTPVEFDTKFSSKVHGYPSLEEFYKPLNCYDSFKNIDVPTLLILSKNDPTYTYDTHHSLDWTSTRGKTSKRTTI